MNKKMLSTLMALMLALVMVMGGLLAAMAETTATVEPTAETTAEPEPTVYDANKVYVTINDVSITVGDITKIYNELLYNYSSYGYDVSTESTQQQIFSMAISYAVQNELVRQHAAELGVAITDEDKAEAQTSFDTAIANYEASLLSGNENPTDEDKAKAHEETLAVAESEGFTLEYLIDNTLLNKAYEAMVKDVTVTDEELAVTDEDVKAHYDEIVASEKESYANDFANYEMMSKLAPYYGQSAPIYVPAGVRGVKHILLAVSDELKTAYQDAQASLEEALDETVAVEGTEATTEPSNEGVKTIEAIEAEIVASVQATVDEIMAKFNAGTSFDELVKEYNTDPGMSTEPQLSQGYYLHLDAQWYDKAFQKAAFEQLEKIGDISAPVVGQSGVHILYYAMDIPEGAPELTAEAMETYKAEMVAEKQENLLYDKQNTAMSEQLTAWEAASTITYAE